MFFSLFIVLFVSLRLSDGKLWWKEKTYKNFAKSSCGLSNKEYEYILNECKIAIEKTVKEIDEFKNSDHNTLEFLEKLKKHWQDEI